MAEPEFEPSVIGLPTLAPLPSGTGESVPSERSTVPRGPQVPRKTRTLGFHTFLPMESSSGTFPSAALGGADRPVPLRVTAPVCLGMRGPYISHPLSPLVIRQEVTSKAFPGWSAVSVIWGPVQEPGHVLLCKSSTSWSPTSVGPPGSGV